jgi:hypothetical protein
VPWDHSTNKFGTGSSYQFRNAAPQIPSILAFRNSSFILVPQRRVRFLRLRLALFAIFTDFLMMNDLELFEHFEVERVPRWPLLIRLVGGSILVHAIFLATVLYVPAVRDALNIASILSGSDFVSKAYKKTNIEDRAQILNLPKFQYPEGYFYKGPTIVPIDPNAPTIIAQATPNPVPPFMMPRARKGKLPNPPMPSPSVSPSLAVGPNDPAALTATTNQPKTAEEADAELTKLAAANNVNRPDEDEINKQPWKDWLKSTNDLKVQGKLDLSKPVEVIILADFDEDGKLTGPPFITQKSGDPALIEVAKGMVAAMIDSNMLFFLRDPKTKRLETRQLQITIKLDDQAVTGKVQSDAASPERAQQLSTTYSGMLYFGTIARQGKDEEILMKNTKVTAEGKQIIINFTMPRHDASELLKKQLQPLT